MIQHTSPISGIAVYQDKYVVTAGYDNRVILWNATTKNALAAGFHDHLANQCQFSEDGRYIVSSSSDYSARIWSVPDMKLIAVLNDHEDDVEGVAFHKNKLWIATVCRDGHVRVFDYKGNLIVKLSGHLRDVLSVAWLNDDELITSSDDGTIKRWSVDKGCCIENKDMGGVETDTIVLTSEGVIFAGNDEGNIIVINEGKHNIVSAHKAGIKRLCYSEAERKIISLSYDRSFSIWKIEDGEKLSLIHHSEYPKIVWARSCDFLGADKIVFVTFGSSYIVYNYKINYWDYDKVEDTHGINAVATYKQDVYTIGDAGILFCNGVKVRQLPSLCNFITGVDGHLITGGQTGELFDALTGEMIYEHHSPLNCGTSFRKNQSDYFIVGSYTGEGIVLKATSKGYQLDSILPLHNNAVKSISADDKYIFSVCATGAAAFHDINNYHCIHKDNEAHEKISNGCTYISPGKFASVSRDLKLRFFELDKAEIIATPHSHSIKCIAATHDGQFVATGGYHGDIHIYDVRKSEWNSFRPSNSGISSLCYLSPDQCFLASSYNGKVYRLPVNKE